MKRIILVDGFEIWNEGIKKALTGGMDLEIVLESTDRWQIQSTVSKGEVDLVILDLDLPAEDGFEILRAIKTVKSDLPVLIFSILGEETYGIRALREGAAGYLTKYCSSDELRTAVLKIMDGKRYISDQLAHRLVDYVENGESSMPPHERLTMREFQVMLMIGQGMALKEIAEKLCLSYSTVATHKDMILRKMGLGSIAGVIRYVSSKGLSGSV